MTTRSTALVLGLLLTACADASLDPMDEPGAAAGSGAYAGSPSVFAGAGATVAPYMAGSAAPIVAGSGGQAAAGTSAAGHVAVAGAGGSAAGATAQAGGAGGSVAVAGNGSAGSVGTAGAAAQAGAGGAPAPVVHELWTITQSNAKQGGTSVNTVRAPQSLTAMLDPSGPGSVAATGTEWAFAGGDTVDHMFTTIPGASTVEAAYLNCGAFRAHWVSDGGAAHGGADVTGPVTPETPAHIAYVHLVASSKLTGSTEAWLLEVSVTWTAYGY